MALHKEGRRRQLDKDRGGKFSAAQRKANDKRKHRHTQKIKVGKQIRNKRGMEAVGIKERTSE